MEIKTALCDLGASVSIMSYSLFHKVYLRPLQAAPFSLQLADGSKMQLISKLEDAPVNIRDIWVLQDFIIVDMPETDGCHINVRKGRITFEVQGHYAVFCHMKKKVVSPNSSVLDESPPPLRLTCRMS